MSHAVFQHDYATRMADWVQTERTRTCGETAAVTYEKLHAVRFRKTLDFCRSLRPNRDAAVLDVGRSNFTAELARYYHRVTSLGYDLAADDGGHRENGLQDVPHLVADLNQCSRVEDWPKTEERFDLIVYAETLEHLHTSPEFSLLMLGSLLKPGGAMLVTTPNALSMTKRLRMLAGRHPYERIRFFAQNPGHFREYTRPELMAMGPACELNVRSCRYVNFYNHGVFNLLKLWPTMSDSLVVVYERPSA